MNLNSVSTLKRNLIFQALDTWQDCKQDKNIFLNTMAGLGWENSLLHCSDGSFKICIWKKSIIAKFARWSNQDCRSEIEREYEQYQAIPREFKKYLTRSYIVDNGLLIQDRVLVKCNVGYCCESLSSIRKKLGHQLIDESHNHGHSKKGTVKFFDWVYRRGHPWIGNPNKPLAEE